jgi:hypothetical protein
MTKIKDQLNGTATADAAKLFSAATVSLERNRQDPEKALAAFMDRIRVSPEVRALIGLEHLKSEALLYLIDRAADMRGKDSSQEEKVGGVQALAESHCFRGPADINSVPPKRRGAGLCAA